MADAFVGQLTLVAFNFAPRGWEQCAGQTLPIAPNTALFSLLGTYYGGDGKSNFMLPNLQGACAVGMGQAPGLDDYVLGQSGGTPAHSLITSEVPSHSHSFLAKATLSNETSPAGNTLADSRPGNLYTNANPAHVVPLTTSITPNGGNQPHNNMMPYLALNWVIALTGIYPPRP